MADPASNPATGAWDMAKKHPYAVGGAIFGLVLVIWYYQSSSTTATTSSGAATSNDPTGDAAAITSAQIAANEATAQGAQTLQGTQSTNDMLTTLGLASLTANSVASTGSSYYNSLSEISASNSATAIASLEAGDFEQTANDQTVSNEFGDLSALLASYAGSYQNIVSNGYTASGATSNTNGFGGGNWGSKAGTATNASPLGPATYQLPTDVVSATTDTSAWGRIKGWFKGAASNVSTTTTVVSTEEPTAALQAAQGGVGSVLGLQPTITANLTGFNTLAGLFGAGVTTPAATGDPVSLASLGAITVGAVNSNYNAA